MDRHWLRFTGMLCGFLMLGAGFPALAVSHYSAIAPVAAKSAMRESFRLAPGTVPSRLVPLAPIAAERVLEVKSANGQSWNKRLQIGIGRDVPQSQEADSAALLWMPVSGGLAAHWEVSSSGARALRLGFIAAKLPAGIEIRFAGEGDRDTVYGPFAAADVVAMGATFWSPVLEGERAFVEIFLPGVDSPFDVGMVLAQVSHLFASPSQADVEILAKAAQFCEVDLVCRSATDEALARAGKSVARMTFSDGTGGGTYLCTGTLLNPADGSFVPYFYSANHCIDTQASAGTLTTHWFYDRVGCGTGGTSASYVQLTGGATLLYANEPSDALLLRLNGTPPAGAVFAGWDQDTLATGTALTAVHHPAGDLKKVSLASSGGFGSAANSGGPSGSFVIARWNSIATGVTEGGSSGSGIFTAVGQPASDYRFRGGLWGGPSSCSAPAGNLYDYYSRFDQVYPAIAQYLNPVLTVTVAKAGAGSGSVVSSPAGIDCGITCAANFNAGTIVTLSAVAETGSVFTGWSGGGCTGAGTCAVTLNAAATVTANFVVLAETPTALAMPASVDFGGQSMNTTAPAQMVTLMNVGKGTLGVTDISSSAPEFKPAHACTTLATGEACTVAVTFTPSAAAAFSGSLSIATSGGTQLVAMAGTGEKSLTTHYYRSILRRAPDSGGKVFWDGESSRVQALGVNVNEVWFTMSAAFYSSAEYAAFKRDNAAFVTDLYGTFFNRAPDAAGFADWMGQLAAGMPREVVLTSFMFSPEFAAFTQAIFGTTSVRKEIDVVGDFYRGLLARLPDNDGFAFWVQQFRTAQCQSASAVTAQAESMSRQFAQSGEYLARNRSNGQYVGDLYNAFLRRGGELAGVQFWIAQLDSGARTRESVRQAFVGSPEFQARVAAIIAEGCVP